MLFDITHVNLNAGIGLRLVYSAHVHMYMYLSSNIQVAGLVLWEDGEELSDTEVEIIGHFLLRSWEPSIVGVAETSTNLNQTETGHFYGMLVQTNIMYMYMYIA